MSVTKAHDVGQRFELFYSSWLIPWLRKQKDVKELSQNGLAEKLDMNSSKLSNWRKGTNTPRRLPLENLAKATDHPQPEAVATFVLEGGEPPFPVTAPATLDDSKDPRRATTAMNTDSPPGGTVVPLPVIDPESAIDAAVEDIQAGRSSEAVQKLEFVKWTIRATQAARRAGLAGILVAGSTVLNAFSTYDDMPGNAKIQREKITQWAEVEAQREGAKEAKRRRRQG